MHEWLSGPPYPSALPSAEEPRRPLARVLPYLVDAWIVVVWFAVAGVIGALIWWQVTPLAAYTRTAENGTMDEQQLAIQIATDGWYFVVAALGGLLSGVALLLWRRRDPVVLVLMVGAAGFLASVVMLKVGLWLGPADPKHVLQHIAVGQKASLQLKPLGAKGHPFDGGSLWFVWSAASLAGAVLALLVGEFLTSGKRHREAMNQYLAPAGTSA